MGAKVKLSVWDLSGKDEHKALREFAYSKADVVIFCFSLAQLEVQGAAEGNIMGTESGSIPTLSLLSVKNKWLPEIKKPVVKILVGTKSDQLFIEKGSESELQVN